jgi:adenylate cyclase
MSLMHKLKNYRIPIATKIILLTVSIVIGATALISSQSSDFFRKVMIRREDYSNMAETSARAKETENLLSSALERSQIIATLMASQNNDEQLNLNFGKDKNLVSIELWKVTGSTFEFVARKSKEEFFTAHKVHGQWMADVRQKIPFPMSSVAQKNIEVRNSTLDPKVPLLTLGFPLGRDENDQVRFVVLADLQMGLLQKSFTEPGERLFYLLDRAGGLLAHKEESFVLARSAAVRSALVEKSETDTSLRRQIRFTEPGTGEAFIGAFVKIPFWGVTVIGQTAEAIILEPARQVQRRAYYISGVVTSIALFLCFVFSMTLTSPLEQLAHLIKLVSRGNFNVSARAKVKSHDEVGDLATAFDHMTEGLRERDKVKNLFSKFHGSTVAEDLIKNDIVMGGTRKDVTVFFSDIRGFTEFSEGHTPEEVVTMLNEYFAVMVKIINARGGVVDKFIGDAIMAIWGAPHTTERDTHQAVGACLEMRQALAELNQLRESRGQSAIKIGMGVHCGPAISGTIGSDERMEYTVIGDTVNMTSRIEASTKVFGTDLLVSDDVAKKLESEFWLESAGNVEVKGKAEPLTLFKVRGTKNAAGETSEVRTAFSDYQSEKDDKTKVVV